MNRDDPVIEAKAQSIYDGWKDQSGWVPWTKHGNSNKQDDARRIARAQLAADACTNPFAGLSQEECDELARLGAAT